MSSSAAAANQEHLDNLLPSKLVVTVGTYDGVLAGWELKHQTPKSTDIRPRRALEISFATPVHGGSIRSLCLALNPTSDVNLPGSLLSTGYDEMLKTHDWNKRLTSSGEVRTPTDFGTPVCASFAPPYSSQVQPQSLDQHSHHSSHCIVGFTNGKVVIYKKRDWSVQHILAGHTGGVASLAVHPSGKLALSGGQSDGKLKLWDLTKGRLTFVTKVNFSTINGRTVTEPILSLIWSADGSAYGYCHGSHITVRDVASGKDLLNVEVPSRVNEMTIMQGEQGTFVAAACNDGSLPVLAVQDVNGQDDERRAIMAIEPVDSPVAGEERYKCIHNTCGYYVVTANSAGVVSLMNLQGAVNMIMTSSPEDDDDNAVDPVDSDNPAASDEESDNDDSDSKEPKRKQKKQPTTDDDDEGGEEELAVDIIDAVQLGSGARITSMVAWACQEEDETEEDAEAEQEDDSDSVEEAENDVENNDKSDAANNDKKRKFGNKQHEVEMDPESLEKARSLVAKAKKIQKRQSSKKRKLVPPGE